MKNDPRGRVLLITTDYPPEIGGLQTYSHRIAAALPGALLGGVLAGVGRGSAPAPLPSGGAPLLMRRGRSRRRALLWASWSIPWLRIRGLRILLHMQWTTALPSLALRRLLPGTRYVVLVHGAELIDPGRPLVAWARRAVLAGADAVVAGSVHTAEIVSQLGIRCRRLEVIPYGNPLDGGEPEPAEGPRGNSEDTSAPRLLCMHRLVARKGTALLLEALAGLVDRPWRLDIVGRGEEEGALKKLASDRGLAGRVAFHPPVDEAGKRRMLREASLFVLPSLPPVMNNHVEGLGLTLLEAQSQGLPVLAARTGGIPEGVREGRTGVLFRAGDVLDLRGKLAELLDSPATLAELRREGPAWVRENFDWDKSLARLAALLEEIAGR